MEFCCVHNSRKALQLRMSYRIGEALPLRQNGGKRCSVATRQEGVLQQHFNVMHNAFKLEWPRSIARVRVRVCVNLLLTENLCLGLSKDIQSTSMYIPGRL